MFEKALVLDTCALLWLARGDKRISREGLSAIQHCSIVFVSAISAWEIGLKAERKLIDLPMEPLTWFTSVLSHHHLALAPLDIDILIAANRLPWHHRDPADRFIIATAIKENAAVVTSDVRFEEYGVRIVL
jgi:PIN domain nuclease of toxin-antitoxin system